MVSSFTLLCGWSSFVRLLPSSVSLFLEPLASSRSGNCTLVPDVWARKRDFSNDRRWHKLGKEFGRYNKRSWQCRCRVAMAFSQWDCCALRVVHRRPVSHVICCDAACQKATCVRHDKHKFLFQIWWRSRVVWNTPRNVEWSYLSFNKFIAHAESRELYQLDLTIR